MDLTLRRELMEVARGERAADLFLRGGTVANVYSGELWPANVAVYRGRIAYVGTRRTGLGAATHEVDVAGRLLSPGLVEPHTHPFLLYTPLAAMATGLAHGVTAMFCDTTALASGWGAAGLRRFMDDSLAFPAFVRWLIRPNNGAAPAADDGPFSLSSLKNLLAHPATVALSEFSWLPLYRSDPDLLAAIAGAEAAGRRAEGHTPGASAERLSTLVVAGLTSDHEAITGSEVLDRLRLGLWVMLRHSSLRPDLPAVITAFTDLGAATHRAMFTTDGSSAAFIADNGLQDGIIRQAIRLGVAPMTALQMATINPATYFHCDADIGGIAPGRRADIVVLDSLDDFAVGDVYCAGECMASAGEVSAQPDVPWPQYGPPLALAEPAFWRRPELYRLPESTPSGDRFPVVEFVSGVITRRRDVVLTPVAGFLEPLDDPDVYPFCLVVPDGSAIVRGLCAGLAVDVAGFAATFNVAGQMAVFGRSPADMAVAAARVAELGGGMALAEGGRVIWELPLPIFGYMTTLPMHGVAAAERELLALLRVRGFRHNDVIYCLQFLPADFLPKIRVTPRGVVDLTTDHVLVPPVSLNSPN